MGRSVAVKLLALMVAATAAAAQGPAPAPANACAGPEFRQFDFWVGEWTVMVGDTAVAGVNRITPMLGGCALREEWQGAGGMRGTSINMFDRASGTWRQAWFADDGLVLQLEGGLVDGRMVLSGSRPAPRRPGVTLFDRITWSASADGSVRQVWDVSEDGGTTWRTIFDGRYVKPERAAPARATPAANTWPQWSPDGARIVFASTRDGGDWEIYTMRADGSDARRLTRSPGRDAHPYFLPDGRRIVFQSPRERSEPDQVDLYLMEADGRRQRRIVAAAGFNGVPVPSPDGAWIAFQRSPLRASGGDFHWELFVVDSGGGNERQLTSNTWSSQVPTWSPDSRRMAIHADPEGRDQLFILDLATRATVPLAPSAGADNAPAWSPDGRSVAFISTRDGPRDLYRVDVAGGAVTRLTHGLDIWGQPSWSPDGRRLLVSARATGVDQVYVVGVDGTGLARLTGEPSEFAEGYVVTDDSVRLYYRIVGSGAETVVIPVGFYLEDLLAPLAAAGRRLVFYDPRHRGRSGRGDLARVSLDRQIGDLEQLRAALGIERMAIIGWSGLGMEMAVYAMRHPERVTRLVQVGAVPPAARLMREAGGDRRAERTDREAIAALDRRFEAGEFASVPAEFCRQRTRLTRAGNFADSALAVRVPDVCAWENEWPVHLWPYFGALLGSFGDYDWTDDLARLTIPRLVVHGREDGIPLAGARAWAAYPSARLLILSPAGHFPFIERPDEFFPAVDEFLRGAWPANARPVAPVSRP